MRHTKFKLFFAWEYEKEEKWLNEMSEKGFQLVQVGFCRYVFEDGLKEQYTYRLELLENSPSNYKSIEYVQFLEETGVEYVDSLFRWAYFRKNIADGDFEIYSDVESKISHYKRILYLFLCVTPINVVNAINMLSQYEAFGRSSNLWAGLLCILLSTLLFFGIGTVYGRIRFLRKEKWIRE